MKWIFLLVILSGCATTTKQVIVEWRVGNEASVKKEGVVCIITTPPKETYNDFGKKLIDCLSKGD